MELDNLIVGSEVCPKKSILKILRFSPIIKENWSILAEELDVPGDIVKTFRKNLLLDKVTFHEILVEIVDNWISRVGSDAKLIKLIHATEECEALDVGESLRLEFNLPCKAAETNGQIGWNGIAQGFKDKVKDTLKNLFTDGNFEELLPSLEGELLISLMRGQLPISLMFKATVPDEISYYVKRSVSTRNIISTAIFKRKEKIDDIFVFQGMNHFELSQQVKVSTSNSTDQLRKVTVKNILLDQKLHFDKLAKKTTHPIHLFKRDADSKKLKWVKSNGNLNVVQAHVDSSQDNFSEQNFLKHVDKTNMDKPVCIGDTPGMGKSILLAHIGHRLKDAKPSTPVFFIVLHELINKIKEKQAGEEDLSKAIVNALQETVCANIVGEAFLQSKINSSKDIEFELLLDGFDEVDNEDYQSAYQILQTIKSSLKCVRLWVTTRPHFLEELENKLNVLGYNIQPFSVADQVQFLTTFWSRKRKLDEDKAEKFARHSLNSLKDRMSTKDDDIAGVPLQCLLIGEVYEEDALEFARLNDEENDDQMVQIDSETITSLYEKLIQKKFNKYRKTYQTKLEDKELISMHVALSLKLIFPEQFKTLETFFGLGHVLIEEVLKVGILEGSSTRETPRFIHRTFAEYFIALFVIDKLKSESGWPKDLNELFFNNILSCQSKYLLDGTSTSTFEFVYPVIAYFLNSLITKSCSRALSVQPKDDWFEERMLYTAQACLISDSLELFTFLQESSAFDKTEGTMFDDKFLFLAIKYAGLEMVKYILALYLEHNAFDLAIRRKLLRESVKRGEFSIVNYFITDKELGCLLDKDDPFGMWTLLHDCVQESNGCSEWMIKKQKIEVIKLLLDINPALLEEKDKEGRTPIFVDKVHVNLILELVSLGAEILDPNPNNYATILHSVRNYWLSSEDYHVLVMNLPEIKLKNIVNVKDYCGSTPLLILLDSFSPKLESIDRLRKVGANFGDSEAFSLLEVAIVRGQNSNILMKLIECGASTDWEDQNSGKNLLHCAAEAGNIDAVELLTSEHGFDVNVEDNDGLTPLNYAIKYENHYEYGDRYETGVYLSQYSGKFKNRTNSKGQTLLHVAAKRKNFTSVRLLIKLEMDVNVADRQGNTPLHLAVMQHKISHKPCLPVVERLLESGADPNALNNADETALHIAIAMKKRNQSDPETLTLLKSHTTLTPQLANLMLNVFVDKSDLTFEVRATDESDIIHDILLECIERGGESHAFWEEKNLRDNPANTLIDEEFLYYIITKFKLKVFKVVLTEFKSRCILDVAIKKKLLSLSVKCGKYVILEYLVNGLEWRGMVEKMSSQPNTFIKDCIGDTKSESNITDRIKVLELLLDINPKLINGIHEYCKQSQSPFNLDQSPFQNVHTDLNVKLAQLGVDVLAIEHTMFKPIIVRASHFCSTKEYFHLLVSNTHPQRIKQVVRIKNASNETPLAAAISYMDLLPETVEAFKDAEADFNFIDCRGYSVLAIAISSLRSVTTLKNLINCGADVDWKGQKQLGGLLHIAAKYGHTSAIEYLISDHDFDVNVKDKCGLKPLDYVILGRDRRYWPNDPFKTGILLKDLGGEFRKSLRSRSLLCRAVKQGQYDLAKLLIYLEFNVNETDNDDNTPLHLALNLSSKYRYSSYSFIKFLLDNKASTRAINKVGETPISLLLFCKQLDLKILQLFKNKTDIDWTISLANIKLKLVINTNKNIDDDEFFSLVQECIIKGARLDYKNKDNESVLLIAIKRGHLRAVRYLLQDHNFDMSSIYQAAAETNSLEMLKSLGKVFKSDEERFSILHERIELFSPSEYHKLVTHIVKQNLAYLYNIKDDNNMSTVFQRAVKSLELNCATLKLLHSNGVDFNTLDESGSSILFYAVKGGRSVPFLSDLINKFNANPSHLDNNSCSLLHILAKDFRMDNSVLVYLLELNCMDVNGRNVDGHTPLWLARYNIKKCRLLIKYGADVSSLNEMVQSLPEDYSYASDIISKLKLPIEHGISLLPKSENNFTFLHSFISKCESSSEFHLLAEYLVEKGYSCLFNINGLSNKYSGFSKDETSPTPFQLAVRRFKVNEKTLELLHSKGVNFNAVNNKGDSVLSYAVMGWRNPDFLSTLIKLGADPKHLNLKGESLLHIAARYGTAGALKFLLDLKVLDANLKNLEGNAPIHIVISSGRKVDIFEKFKFLIESGADVNAVNEHKQAALHHAILAEGDCSEIVSPFDVMQVRGLELNGSEKDIRLKLIKYLVNKGANVYARDARLRTFVHDFVLSRSTCSELRSLFRFLAKKGYKTLFTTPVIMLMGGRTSRSMTPLELDQLPWEAKLMLYMHAQVIPIFQE